MKRIPIAVVCGLLAFTVSGGLASADTTVVNPPPVPIPATQVTPPPMTITLPPPPPPVTTTVTAPPVTTTVTAPPVTTTVTAPPTTTTTTPTTTSTTTTTTPPPPCGAPINITTGGTYSGCYQSNSTGTPAVTISTTAPVTLSRAHIIAKANGVTGTVNGIRLTVTDSVFDQQNPGAVVKHRAVEVQNPASFVFTNNKLTDTDGVWVGGGGGSPNPLTVDANLAINIGRYPHPTSPNCCVQFLQLDHVVTPAGHIFWNHTQNTAGVSGVEDNIDEYISGGTDSAHRLDIGFNLIDGAYPAGLNDSQFTGGGINQGDGGGGHSMAHDNTVVSTTNYGISAHSDDNFITNNLLVNDGVGQVSDYGQAVVSFQNVTPAGVHATNNRYNWHRFPGDTAQWPCYTSDRCSGGTQVATTEQQARDAWDASRAGAAVVVGPR